jgi:hypothetical protein
MRVNKQEGHRFDVDKFNFWNINGMDVMKQKQIMI